MVLVSGDGERCHVGTGSQSFSNLSVPAVIVPRPLATLHFWLCFPLYTLVVYALAFGLWLFPTSVSTFHLFLSLAAPQHWSVLNVSWEVHGPQIVL